MARHNSLLEYTRQCNNHSTSSLEWNIKTWLLTSAPVCPASPGGPIGPVEPYKGERIKRIGTEIQHHTWKQEKKKQIKKIHHPLTMHLHETWDSNGKWRSRETNNGRAKFGFRLAVLVGTISSDHVITITFISMRWVSDSVLRLWGQLNVVASTGPTQNRGLEMERKKW